jgi:uncharacterized protein (DUF1330 family)
MAAYVIADTKIEDAAAYEEYKRLARAAAEAHGGEYLARGGRTIVDDNDLWSPTRRVIIRFPSFAAAEAFLASPAYAPIKAIRRGAAQSTLVVVEGL